MAETRTDDPFFIHEPKEKKKKKKYHPMGEPIPLEKETTIGNMKKKWDDAKIRPYVKVRDFNNDPSDPYMNPPKIGVDAGIRISF